MNFIKWKNNDKERERDFKHAKYICYWNIILSNKCIGDFILKKNMFWWNVNVKFITTELLWDSVFQSC